MNIYRHIIRPLIFMLPPEQAHSFSLCALDWAYKLGLLKLLPPPVQAPNFMMGLHFPNSVGLAAGLDKNAEHLNALGALGFGFIEVGTVTPRPQAGNAKPRMFRLKRVGGIINRFGFNNVGVAQFIKNIQRSDYKGILGINIGKNFDTPNEKAVEDYLFCLHHVYPYADYITINISSPNTTNLRQLQDRKALNSLLKQMKQAQTLLAQEHGKYVPLVLKIAPDLNTKQIHEIADAMISNNIDAVIATNTTLSRYEVEDEEYADQAGGLSGAPLMQRSTFVVEILADYLRGRVPIIGAGGIFCGADACDKHDVGATLVQIYSGLIYQGPSLIHEVAEALA